MNAKVVGSDDDFLSTSADIDWYEYVGGGYVLLESNMDVGTLWLAEGTHALVASVAVPGSASMDSINVTVHREMDVLIGSVTFSGGNAKVPISVSDDGIAVRSHLEYSISEAGGSERYGQAETDGSGQATLTIRSLRSGSYTLDVAAHEIDGHRFGWSTASFTR